MMCAGDMRSEEMLSPCMAVPGAPLVVEGNLVGLQSWGFGCGYVNDHPLVYTSLTVYQPWLVHNIPILRQIQRTQLSSLFQATKASYLSQWLLKTRVNVPAFKMPLLDVLRPLDVDTDLVKLNGTITDIRDYIFDYKYKNQKRLMYGELKNHLKIQDVHETYQNSQVLRASPFLNDSVLNDMGLSQSNGTLIEVGKSEEDSYYKELTSKDSTESNRINNQNTEFDSFYQTEAKPSVYF
ncbi:unnamed protein product [Diatraea saccharalis]|uniref:Peptidase S1 domain-containing protein n=1 Tax=Diatraea saccharalis TaxID=40085 RepID=A0A9N9QKJ1_9NEOP|nr:unnamed protein product [Diatraea saccharalis]